MWAEVVLHFVMLAISIQTKLIGKALFNLLLDSALPITLIVLMKVIFT